MPQTSRRFLDAFERVDLGIAAAGFVGALLVILVLPHLLPERAAQHHISRKDAIAAARTFAEHSSGINLEDAVPTATIRQSSSLLDSLQEMLGRRRALTSVVLDSIPVYYWHVRWTEQDDDRREEIGTVSLTLDGRPTDFSLEADAVPTRAFHADALKSLADGDSSLADVDSASLSRRSFRLDGEDASGSISDRGRVFLNKSDAAALAKYHLSRTALANVVDEADSVKASGRDGRVTATAHFSSIDTTVSRRYNVSVEVTPAGSLVSIKSDRTGSAAEKQDAFDAEQAAGLAVALVFAVLVILMLVIFFRRLTARLIDARMALRDGLFFGLAAGIMVAGETAGDLNSKSLVELGGIVLSLLLVGGISAVLIFFLSGAASSITRDVWEEKLQSLDLLRNGYIRNVPVGRSLVRGILCALSVLGFLALFLLFVQDVRMDASGQEVFYKSTIPGLSFLVLAGRFAFGSFFTTLAAVVGVGVLVRRKTANVVLATGTIAVVLAAVQISPLDLRPIWLEFAVSAVLGLALGWILWRFDVITTFATFFFMFLIWENLGALTVPSSPEFFNSLLTFATVAVVGVVGFIGVASGKTSTEIPVIVPDYIEELSHRERLKREFELAREVQLSFLPAATPDIRGVEIASVCLPATEVGGDYYDFFQMDGKLGMVVGDVSGKGMQAAFYMTLMKGILQSVVRGGESPSGVLSRANELFRLNSSRGTFMSMIFGVLNSHTGEWTFARAGHNPLVLSRSSMPRPEVLQPKGAALGLASEHIFDGSIEEMTLSLAQGDVLVIYTDGITEAMNLKRELYDDTRLLDVVARCRGESAQEMLVSIIADVEAFTGAAPRHDDMTLLVIRMVGA